MSSVTWSNFQGQPKSTMGAGAGATSIPFSQAADSTLEQSPAFVFVCFVLSRGDYRPLLQVLRSELGPGCP